MPIPRHALVLSAGLGTRLRPLTSVRAKPALPVAGEPMARRIIAWLVANGVTDITLNLHHLPQTLTAVVGDGSDLGARVRYSWEHPVILGSAGGPRQALDIIGDEMFFLVNGDTLTDANLADLWRAHEVAGALVTLALVPNIEPTRYGGVQLADDGTVLGFVPRGPLAHGTLHFIGVQVASRDAFTTLPPGQPTSSIGGHYDRLIANRPGSVRGLVVHAAFWDVGTVSDYWHTSQRFSAAPTVAYGAGTHVAVSARVTRSILWDHVSIGDRAHVDECIVTDGVCLPADVVYKRAILIRGADGQTVATSFTPD